MRARVCVCVCVLMYETLVCVSLCECLYVLFIVWNASQKGYRILSWMKNNVDVCLVHCSFSSDVWMLLETVLCKSKTKKIVWTCKVNLPS